MPNRSPIVEQYERARAMMLYVQENLSAEEYLAFVDMVAPLPEPEPESVKKPQKKSGRKSATKSPRASGMQAQLNTRLAGRERQRQDEREEAARGITGEAMVPQSVIDAAFDPRTVKRCEVCGNDEDYQDHFKPSPNYHEFDVGKSSLPAPTAPERSSSASAAKDDNYGVNLEGVGAFAGAVPGDSNER